MQLPADLQTSDHPDTPSNGYREQEVSELWHSLTPKQQSWLMEYLTNGLNAARAVKDSAYETDDDESCRAMGHKNRTHPKLRPLIQHACRRHMTEGEVLKRVSQIARASWEDFLSFENDRVVPDLEKARDRGKMHLVEQVKFDTVLNEETGEVVRYVSEIKLKDDQKAHDQLLKATGAYELNAPDATVENLTINQWNQQLNAHHQGTGERWPEVEEAKEAKNGHEGQ